MFSDSTFARGACVAFLAFLAAGCDSMTASDNEGNACDPTTPGVCGEGLACYVPPNCAIAICCPPQDAANPVCYCPAPPGAASDAAGAVDGSKPDAPSMSDGSPADRRAD
jgi:hypothetical protein